MGKLKHKLKYFKSMRVHVFFALIMVGGICILMLSFGIHSNYRENSIALKVSEVRDYSGKVFNRMIRNAYLTNSSNLPEISTELKYAAAFYEGRIILIDSNLRIIVDTYEIEQGKTLISEEAIRCLQGKDSEYRDDQSRTLELTLGIADTTDESSSNPVVGAMIFSFSTDNTFSILEKMDQRIAFISFSCFVILFIFSYLYTLRLTRPLKEISRIIKHVTDGYMEDKVAIKGFLEIERISDSFNEMLSRIKMLEDSRQEFVSNVSHELKTPITSIKVLADSLLMQEEAPVEMYREFMSDINDEIDRENKIITDLLSLVKLDRKAGEMHIAEVSVNELMEIILKRLKPIAQQRNIEVVYESFRPVIAEVDEVKISLGLSNLIENAIKYNKDDGWVRVSLNSDHKYFYVKVSDSGSGIPEEEQSRIFDRFYRVDKTRARETGGTGLGLAITKSVILMHKGAIKVHSEEGEGTTFTVRIPLSFIA